MPRKTKNTETQVTYEYRPKSTVYGVYIVSFMKGKRLYNSDISDPVEAGYKLGSYEDGEVVSVYDESGRFLGESVCVKEEYIHADDL